MSVKRTKLSALTQEQRDFASEHHGLIYKFLNHYRLEESDYYDVVAFSYLRAVQMYLNRNDLQRYSFSTIVFKTMRSTIGNHRKKLKLRARLEFACALDEPIYANNCLTAQEAIPDPSDDYDNILSEINATDIMSAYAHHEKYLLALKSQGYHVKELAAVFGVSKSTICKWVKEIRSRSQMIKEGVSI